MQKVCRAKIDDNVNFTFRVLNFSFSLYLSFFFTFLISKQVSKLKKKDTCKSFFTPLFITKNYVIPQHVQIYKELLLCEVSYPSYF